MSKNDISRFRMGGMVLFALATIGIIVGVISASSYDSKHQIAISVVSHQALATNGHEICYRLYGTYGSQNVTCIYSIDVYSDDYKICYDSSNNVCSVCRFSHTANLIIAGTILLFIMIRCFIVPLILCCTNKRKSVISSFI